MSEEEKNAIERIKGIIGKNVHTFVDELNLILNLIQNQQSELEKKDKIIDLMTKFIDKRINECPYDFWIEAEKELNCENCEEDYAQCWKQYFERKVKEC